MIIPLPADQRGKDFGNLLNDVQALLKARVGDSEAGTWRWHMQEYFCEMYPKHLTDCYKKDEVYKVLKGCLEKYKKNLQEGGGYDETYDAENIWEHIKTVFKGQPILSTLRGPINRTVHEPLPREGLRDRFVRVLRGGRGR